MARVVAGAVASVVVRAAINEEIKDILEGKNWEISRLRDKLEYNSSIGKCHKGTKKSLRLAKGKNDGINGGKSGLLDAFVLHFVWAE
ncbi:hypothetical protein GOP47_0006514 [Adiantum capillus-veneris]|uniref:Uncharacterized protein n=1 Tax=Adiantum capillus-veneris TaxID=13818 RepID=A0A9D4V408_ADICA|nr:hypothetical protein GOP47_0006514 [Adiantum capillus-veneris]